MSETFRRARRLLASVLPAALRPRTTRALIGRLGTPHALTACGVGMPRRRLVYESLEPRRVLALVTVTTLEDSVDFDDGVTSLREAIFAANTVPGADEIQFAPELFAEGPGAILLKHGELKIKESLTINGPGSSVLTIDAAGSDPTPSVPHGDGTRIFNIDDGLEISSMDAALAGMTLTHADISSTGGAVRSVESLRVDGMVFIQNNALDGAAIWASVGGASSFIVTASVAAQNRGRAISFILQDDANATISKSTISDNEQAIPYGTGGGLAVQNSGRGNVSIAQNLLLRNHTMSISAEGGGMYASFSGAGSLSLEGNAFSGNTTQGTGAEGGGMYASFSGAGSLSLEDNAFSGNMTHGTGAEGGGMYASFSGAGSLSLEENAFSGNTTHGTGAEGGGAYLQAWVTGTVVLTGNRFTDNATSGTSASGGGAYVFSQLGNVLVEENVFVSNDSSGTEAGGGGLYLSARSGRSSLVRNNDFLENTSRGTGSDGGGLAVYGSSQVTGNLFAENLSGGTSASGNGLYAEVGAGTTLIADNRVAGNAQVSDRPPGNGGVAVRALIGGAILVEHNVIERNYGGVFAVSSGSIDVLENIIVDNVSTGLFLLASGEGVARGARNAILRNIGGAILNPTSRGTVIVEDSVVADNKSLQSIGGVYMFVTSGGKAILQRVTVSGNSVGAVQFPSNGGGLSIDNRGGTVLVDQSTISGNSAWGSGGGVWLSNIQPAGDIAIRRTTITGNQTEIVDERFGPKGGGGASIGKRPLTLDHTIVAGNVDKGGIAPDIATSLDADFPVVIKAVYSLIGTNIGSNLAEAPLGSPDANGNLIGGPVHGAIDPLLGPLADNGGPAHPGGAKLLTHALLPGSPAIDAGDQAALPGQNGVPEFDERGAPFTRLAGSRLDIGAFETQAAGGALSADFTLDGVTDGADLLAWQRGLGATTGVTFRRGDATLDGDVDAGDLAVWKARFGTASQAVAPTSLPHSVQEERPRFRAPAFARGVQALAAESPARRTSRPATRDDFRPARSAESDDAAALPDADETPVALAVVDEAFGEF